VTYDGASLAMQIVNARGQVVRSLFRLHQNAGWFIERIGDLKGGTGAGAGIFFCRLRIGNTVLVRRIPMR
jgi:hypothetical protein